MHVLTRCLVVLLQVHFQRHARQSAGLYLAVQVVAIVPEHCHSTSIHNHSYMYNMWI